MDWIIFGDDWGAHPSTTQHLTRGLPADDRVIWINSIGMRAPALGDWRRAAHKVGAMLTRPAPRAATAPTPHIISPRVLPWHASPAARALNARMLGAAVRGAMEELGMREVCALTANPAALPYLDAIQPARMAYLRLDDYALLPGVDPALVHTYEPAIMHRADAVFATARGLMPRAASCHEAHYLPQGVDMAHFGAGPLEIPQGKVVGFFGLFAEWIDAELIAACAQARPDWTFELLGPRRVQPGALCALPNVRWRDAVPYAQLPEAIGHWRAAWMPFRMDELTAQVNPLKLREYLAAGLPTASTPLPELGDYPVTPIRTAADVLAWLDEVEAHDSPTARAARRAHVRADSWIARAATLRAALA